MPREMKESMYINHIKENENDRSTGLDKCPLISVQAINFSFCCKLSANCQDKEQSKSN